MSYHSKKRPKYTRTRKENLSLIKLSNLRFQIDELRKNRNTFRQVLSKAEEDSNMKDQELTSLIAASNDSYSERDRMKMELVRIKQAEKEDIDLFNSELTRFFCSTHFFLNFIKANNIMAIFQDY